MKVLALVEARDHVCCRYRISAFGRALAGAGWSLHVEPLASGPVSRLVQFRRAAGFDAVVLQRKLLPGWQLGELRRRSRRLIFDFDDAVLFRDSYDRRGPHDRRRDERFRRVVRAADEVIAGNAFLAECAEGAGADPIRVRLIPTCVETRAARPSARATAPADGADPAQPSVDLVWIGSSSTMAGLDRERPLWERIGREVAGTRLRMVCDRFLRFDALPVVELPWSEATEAADVAGGDVGVAWVPDDLWSRGKCGLKVLQYQAAGLPVVANPVGVHRDFVRPGVDGFLPESPGAWVEAIQALRDDPELRRRMGRAARASVEAHRSVDAWGSAFVAAVAGVRPAAGAPTRRSGTNQRPLTLAAHDR